MSGQRKTVPGHITAADAFAEDELSQTRTDGQRVFSSGQGSLGIEIKLVHDSREPWRAVELWTARSVYWLDQDRTCIAVLSRRNQRLDLSHKFIGGKLSGGQQRGEQGTSVAQPLPIPGMNAVFKLKTGFAMTSAVEQIIIQVKIDNLAFDGDQPDWDNMSTLLKQIERK